ncbi:DNA mismatch repair protein MutL [Abditibacteriota bacterium]|nr:DNA mismatch repair protein MutL [Abditibacteriota bacterium]
MSRLEPSSLEQPQKLSAQIRHSESTRKAIDTPLYTDQRVLARITDGIYRQPASALRELISNAYDADATEVVILTDAPRFQQISIRDNGRGLSPEVLENLLLHIGGSAKRTRKGQMLGIAGQGNANYSPSGRKLIGKLGIGLFSVAQFTRHFLIITKTQGDTFRTVADITLGGVSRGDVSEDADTDAPLELETGHARIWREYADDTESHGTEIKLLELLPRTRAELASEDLWTKIDYEKDDPDPEAVSSKRPTYHIGRTSRGKPDIIDEVPILPWSPTDSPSERFGKFVQAVRDGVNISESVDLEILCDRYLQTIWNLSIAAPLRYFDCHPFDLDGSSGARFYQLSNKSRGQATEFQLQNKVSARERLGLTTLDGPAGPSFDVFVDGVQLLRPILFKDLPKSAIALKTPMLLLGRVEEKFEGKPSGLSGGPLAFEAYLFSASKIVPKQHQGVMLRVGNASGALFDRNFMGYQVSELGRLRQMTAEIFVSEGLDGAINIDRESFNYAHPHYQFIVKWLHSALRQYTNRHKELGRSAKSERVILQGETTRSDVDKKLEASLKFRGVDEIPEVVILEPERVKDANKLRDQGNIVLNRTEAIPLLNRSQTTEAVQRQKTNEAKARALSQLLHGWGLLNNLSYAEQEKLIHDILDILLDN